MGWTVIRDATRDDVVRELLNDYQPVDYELCDDILWVVIAEEVLDQNLIVCFLLRSPHGGWGYKPLYESMHPFYYGCPLRMLEMTPVSCDEWRNKVREYHKHRFART